ncbi:MULTISPECIES: ABC transporter ATP-binding protein/permease [Tepidiphilus]|jgi:putative ATP-binding cassette transporter|uniref:ABC-type uncharacterized transport system, permease and ATPase components n=1 Tax=Tepidiphilus thermophilus TaxID=876478 RepID=A0A0K6IX21_9PROT|nr:MULTISPECIES: SbmA/BacA-like family transporter [Tepidiphilus]MDK2797549.1 vitamin B12/bleomycin/antimicrobial peptide transport system ATP-binding/permease protein [Tepidiphilus sp.]CUB07584.1 ABC-type uncharacterized transport system, permease and ATPase components [Tepidiphilus thermophilus]
MSAPNPTTPPLLPFLLLGLRYYRRPRAWGGALVLVALTLAMVGLALWTNHWQRALFDALERRDLVELPALIATFLTILLLSVAVTGVHLLVKRGWQLGWRRFLTEQLLESWLARGHHHRLRHLPGAHDNPDARIAEDVRIATEVAVELFHSLLYSLASIVLFVDVLWVVGATPHESPPGTMVWLALAYAGIGTITGVLLGRPLTRATDQQQSREADFRYGLSHIRDKSEAIALAQGEASERRLTRERFDALARTWWKQSLGYLGLVSFSTAYGTLLPVFPILVLAPHYIAGTLTLGMLMQAAQAFERLTNALSWPIHSMGDIARCHASIERAAALYQDLTELEAIERLCLPGQICRSVGPAGQLAIERLTLTLPNGHPVLENFSLTLTRGETVQLVGDPNTGIALLKAIAGVWSWGQGNIILPDGETLAFVPQRPFLPEGPLIAALTYPRDPAEVERKRVIDTLHAVGADALIERLDEHDDWNRTLTAPVQQRLALARTLLERPAWVFYEAPADALPAPGKFDPVALLRERLPDATLAIFWPHHQPYPGVQRVVFLN